MRKITFNLLLIILIWGVIIGRAHSAFIDFDLLSGMSYAAGGPIPLESRLDTQFLASDGVLFSSDSPFLAVVNLGSSRTASGEMGIGGSTLSGLLTYSGTFFKANFYNPNNPLDAAVTDFVSIQGDLIGDNQVVTFSAFDINGNILGTDSQVDVGGNIFSLSFNGIHSVEVTASGSGSMALDNFSFNDVTPGFSIPSFSSLWLFLLGLVFLPKKQIT